MKIKAGVIGTGFIGEAHIEALRRLGMVDVAAIAGSNSRRAGENAERLGIAQAYGDWRELVHDPAIQVVHICTPNHLHFEIAEAALQSGKHVICEKPLVFHADEARKLIRLAEDRGLVGAIHFNLRYYPLVQQARAMMIKGEIGRMLAFGGSYLQDWLFHDTDYNWRIEPGIGGPSRAMADIGSHLLDLAEYVSGERIKAVCAQLANFHPIRKKPLQAVKTYTVSEMSDGNGELLSNEPEYEEIPIGTEDYASVLLEFESGARGSVTVNQVAAGNKNQLRFEINGSACSVGWQSENPNELWIGWRDRPNERLVKDPQLMDASVKSTASYPGGHSEGFPDTSKQLFRQVYDNIMREDYKHGVKPAFPTFEDGLREIELCDAVLRSAESRQWMNV
ncbi:Gfo/Idh/MocA family protein [Paenibacillus paeoniae]|uniref:Gfo/Idh/MocA family oxidoreductase n=1 Tax=Paenibacillus paeoniae TaxID=2292705 RepID=A0A371PGN0_9BACL|nr:Gfo/Idh/MocA family oxidoreductase [Paenibacillus paeoniae]REK74776.1 gfo/Idh/MocA family oxidoreductase [Paenibacillus paeoniae]